MAKQWNCDGALFPSHREGPGGIPSQCEPEQYAINIDDVATFKNMVETVRAVRSKVTADKLNMKIQDLCNCEWLPEPSSIVFINVFGSVLRGHAAMCGYTKF